MDLMEAIDRNERTVIELEYRQKDPAIMKKMAASSRPGIVVNELSPKVTYMFAHMRLKTFQNHSDLKVMLLTRFINTPWN